MENSIGYIFQMSQWQTGIVFLYIALSVVAITLFKKKISNDFSKTIIFSIGLGLIGGISFMLMDMFAPANTIPVDIFNEIVIWHGEADSWLSVIPGIFKSGMLFFVPLMIFTGIVKVITESGDGKGGQKAFIKSFVSLTLTVTVFAIIGIVIGFMAYLMPEGHGIFDNIDGDAGGAVETIPGIIGSWIPGSISIFASTASIVAVVIAGIFISVIILMMEKDTEKKKYAKSFKGGVITLKEVIDKSISVIILLLPYMIASVIPQLFYGGGMSESMTILGIFLAMTVIAWGLNVFTMMGVQYASLKEKPGVVNYAKTMSKPLSISFFSASSAVSAPHSTAAMRDLGVSELEATMYPSAQTSFGMVGSGGLYQMLLVMTTAILFEQFAATSTEYTFTLDASFYFMAIVMVVVTSFGVPAIPGGSHAANMAVMISLGLPVEFFVLTLAIDPITDMMRTTMNVTSTAAVATFMDRFFPTK